MESHKKKGCKRVVHFELYKQNESLRFARASTCLFLWFRLHIRRRRNAEERAITLEENGAVEPWKKKKKQREAKSRSHAVQTRKRVNLIETEDRSLLVFTERSSAGRFLTDTRRGDQE